jgi:uncharacterized protein
VNTTTRKPAIEAGQRFDSIDIMRGLALFGVLIVNLVTEFRVSIFSQFLSGPEHPDALDRAVGLFVHYGLELKAFALFSFLFGLGLALQFERLSGTGKPLYWLSRRLLALLAFGLVHLLLIWNGDILTEYAVAGLIVLPLLKASRKVLAAAAIALFVLYLALPALPPIVAWPDASWLQAHIAEANRVYGAGSWLEVIRFNLQELPALLPLHVTIFPRTLGLFVLGILAWRSGLFARPAEHKTVIFYLGWALGVAGVAMSFAGASGPVSMMAPVCLALAFAAMIVYAVEFTRMRAPLRRFTAIGRMAFTNYIAQSIIFGLVFFGYGLGQFGKLRAAPVFAMGLAVYAAQVQLSKYWLRRYRFGPIEWLWRTLMYGRRQPMKRQLQEAVQDLPAALIDRKHIADQEVDPVAVRDQQ